MPRVRSAAAWLAGALAVTSPSGARAQDPEPPARPQEVEARGTGEAEVTLRWPAVKGAAQYEVRRGDEVVLRTAEPAAVERGLEPYREYCYRVVAIGRGRARSQPSRQACATTLDLTPPPAPEGVSAGATSPEEIVVTWRAAADEGGVASYETFVDGALRVRSFGTTATLPGLWPATQVCARVRSVDRAGNPSPLSEPACATTPDLRAPTAPGGLVAASAASTRVALTWEASRDDVGVVAYEVSRGDAVVATTSGLRATITGLEPGREHCHRVRALDAAGNRSADSEPACVPDADPALPAGPEYLRAAPASAASISLVWEGAGGAGVLYHVYRGNERRLGATRWLAFSDVGLKPATRYCYRVSAIDAAGKESPRTPEACATTLPKAR